MNDQDSEAPLSLYQAARNMGVKFTKENSPTDKYIDVNNLKILPSDITAIILTYNEEKHIERCILSIRELVKKIIIIDSFSTDDTINIVKKYS